MRKNLNVYQGTDSISDYLNPGKAVSAIAVAARLFGIESIKAIVPDEVARHGGAFFAEFVGTFMLVLVIFGTIHNKPTQPGLIIGPLVGDFLITTSSTVFANPQVTFARMFTWTIAGIRPVDTAGFIVVQLMATAVATGVARVLWGSGMGERSQLSVPQHTRSSDAK